MCVCVYRYWLSHEMCTESLPYNKQTHEFEERKKHEGSPFPMPIELIFFRFCSCCSRVSVLRSVMHYFHSCTLMTCHGIYEGPLLPRFIRCQCEQTVHSFLIFSSSSKFSLFSRLSHFYYFFLDQPILHPDCYAAN